MVNFKMALCLYIGAAVGEKGSDVCMYNVLHSELLTLGIVESLILLLLELLFINVNTASSCPACHCCGKEDTLCEV